MCQTNPLSTNYTFLAPLVVISDSVLIFTAYMFWINKFLPTRLKDELYFVLQRWKRSHFKCPLTLRAASFCTQSTDNERCSFALLKCLIIIINLRREPARPAAETPSRSGRKNGHPETRRENLFALNFSQGSSWTHLNPQQQRCRIFFFCLFFLVPALYANVWNPRPDGCGWGRSAGFNSLDPGTLAVRVSGVHVGQPERSSAARWINGTTMEEKFSLLPPSPRRTILPSLPPSRSGRWAVGSPGGGGGAARLNVRPFVEDKAVSGELVWITLVVFLLYTC